MCPNRAYLHNLTLSITNTSKLTSFYETPLSSKRQRVRAKHLPIHPSPAHPDTGALLHLKGNLNLPKNSNVKLDRRYNIPISLINLNYRHSHTGKRYKLITPSLALLRSHVDDSVETLNVDGNFLISEGHPLLPSLSDSSPIQSYKPSQPSDPSLSQQVSRYGSIPSTNASASSTRIPQRGHERVNIPSVSTQRHQSPIYGTTTHPPLRQKAPESYHPYSNLTSADIDEANRHLFTHQSPTRLPPRDITIPINSNLQDHRLYGGIERDRYAAMQREMLQRVRPAGAVERRDAPRRRDSVCVGFLVLVVLGFFLGLAFWIRKAGVGVFEFW